MTPPVLASLAYKDSHKLMPHTPRTEAEDAPILPRVVRQPPRSQRVRQLRAVVGPPNNSVLQLVHGIRSITFTTYEQHVMPLIKAHWPNVLNERFGRKLRFLTCNLYASAPYTVLFCSKERPGLIQAVTRAANALPLPNELLGLATRTALLGVGRLAYQDIHRRIVLIAAFIATIDHAFDHDMDDVEPHERERCIKGLLDGTWAPDRPSLALTRGLQLAMSAGLNGEDAAIFNAALERVKEWAEAEVHGMTGVEDPSGLGHRTAGVEGTIDGLIFPVHRFAGEGVRKWMYDVSMFTQMMDDWIDYDDDLEIDRTTPVISGEWNFDIIAATWYDTVVGIEQITRDCGLDAPHYVAFVRDAYIWMMHEVMEAMITGVAD